MQSNYVKGTGTTETLKTRKEARAMLFVTSTAVNREGHEETREEGGGRGLTPVVSVSQCLSG